MKKRRSRSFLSQFIPVVICCAAFSIHDAYCSAADVLKQETETALLVVSSPQKPSVYTRENILLRAWVANKTSQRLHYVWSASAGKIHGEGKEVRWDFTDVQPGKYTASVSVKDQIGLVGQSSLRVMVLERSGARGRESGWYFLVSNAKEDDGYGLYSFLLFASRPDDVHRDHYLEAIKAYLRLVPDIVSLEKAGIKRQELNITYLPVTRSPREESPSPEWIIDNYDYAKARAILKKLPGDYREGPYIVSFLSPLSDNTDGSRSYLYQDLSRVPTHLISAWMMEFLNQAAQETIWNEGRTESLVLRLRTTVAILAEGLPQVQDSMQKWVTWIRQ